MKTILTIALIVLITAFAYAGSIKILDPQINSWTLTTDSTNTAATGGTTTPAFVGYATKILCQNHTSGSMPFTIQTSIDGTNYFTDIDTVSSTDNISTTTTDGFLYIKPYINTSVTGSVTITCVTN